MPKFIEHRDRMAHRAGSQITSVLIFLTREVIPVAPPSCTHTLNIRSTNALMRFVVIAKHGNMGAFSGTTKINPGFKF